MEERSLSKLMSKDNNIKYNEDRNKRLKVKSSLYLITRYLGGIRLNKLFDSEGARLAWTIQDLATRDCKLPNLSLVRVDLSYAPSHNHSQCISPHQATS